MSCVPVNVLCSGQQQAGRASQNGVLESVQRLSRMVCGETPRESEVENILQELRAVLRDHGQFVRYMALHAMRRAAEKPSPSSDFTDDYKTIKL